MWLLACFFLGGGGLCWGSWAVRALAAADRQFLVSDAIQIALSSLRPWRQDVPERSETGKFWAADFGG